MSTYLITGGAGFVGSNLVHYLLEAEPDANLVIIDKLTYAGNLKCLGSVLDLERVSFEKADIANTDFILNIFARHQPDGIYHLAAASHVARSLLGPSAFHGVRPE